MARRDEEQLAAGNEVAVPGGPGIPAGTTRRDPHNPTRLGGDPTAPPRPFVDPSISDPKALEYAQGAETRRRPPVGTPIPRYMSPVAGGPDLPIPHLASPPTSSAPMAEQARAQRPMPLPAPAGMQEPAFGAPRSSGIVEGVEHQAPTPASAGTGLRLPEGIQPGDLLPEEATKDPMFQQGQGAMFAANQASLAYKYGVIRGGQRIPAQLLRQGSAPQRARGAAQRGGAATGAPQLRPETVEGLQALEALQRERASAEDPSERNIERAARQGPAGGSGGTAPELTEKERSEILEGMDEFDVSKVRNALFKDLLNNDQQKEIIEKRLRPLDLGDLIVNGRVTQLVPIVPGKFEPEFQSYGGDEDLVIKRMLGEEAENLKPSDRYLLDKYTLMGLTIAVKAINRKQLTDYVDANGNFSEELFWKKYKVISRLNYHMLGSLVANWFWFDMRVRRLFKAEDLGNG